MNMTSPVPTEPECPMRRMHRNSHQGVSVHPTYANPINSGVVVGREGRGCFTGPGTDLTSVVGGMPSHIVGRPGRI